MNYPSALLFTLITVFSSGFVFGDVQKDVRMGRELHQDSLEIDDTPYLQSLIDKARHGDTVLIPADTFHVRTLYLRSGVSVKTLGVLKQLAPLKKEKFGISHQQSSSPLFSGKNISDVYLSFRARTLHEAVALENCSNVTLEDVEVYGDTTRFHSFAGIYVTHCDSISVKDSEIAYYGQERQHVKSYQPGTGIRIQSSDNISIQGNTIHHNGENGVFAHSSANVTIDDNQFYRNGMSGIQVAFGSVGREKHYTIRRNVLNENAADAIDINNPDTGRLVSLEALIEGNTSKDNGWVRGHSTPDGSGIATLVGLKEIKVLDNRSSNSNRPAIYVRGCDNVEAIGNEADNVAEIVGDLGDITLYKNTLAGVRLLASVKAQKLQLDSNDIHHLSLSSGIRVDSLIVRSNELKGNININMNGNLVFEGNRLYSPSPLGAISLVKVEGATLSDNHIQSTKAHALLISPLATNVLVEGNKIRAVQACVADQGSQQLRLIRNTMDFTDVVEGEVPFVVSSDLNAIHFEDNAYFQEGEQVQHSYADQVSGR